MTAIDVIKDIAAVVGCIISCITLSGFLIKPIRQFFVKKVSELSNRDLYEAEIKKQSKELADEKDEMQDIKNSCNAIAKSVEELKILVFQNEADRLRGELFNCGNRCRRGIPLTLEEFRYIQEVWAKYDKKLHCNSIGTQEYYFIKEYYESLDNQEALKR